MCVFSSANTQLQANKHTQVLLFAHLASIPTSAPLISSTSLTTLLTSFVAVLDEPGLRAARGDECVRIIVEALLRLGGGAVGTETLRDGVQSYLAGRRVEKELFGDADTSGQFEDVSLPLCLLGVGKGGTTKANESLARNQRLEILVSSLSSDSPVTTSVLPDVYSSLIPASIPDGEGDDMAVVHEPIFLPTVLVPAELEESDLIKVATPAASSSGLRGDEGVGYEGVRMYLKLFEDEVRT